MQILIPHQLPSKKTDLQKSVMIYHQKSVKSVMTPHTSKGKIEAQVPMHQDTRGFVIRPLLSASHTSYSSAPPTSPRSTNI